MASQEPFLRLHKHLLERRETLLRSLKLEVDDSTDATSVQSQLVELEQRELVKIEHALQRMQSDTYGICEGCGKKIPMVRLNALPYTTLCIQCFR